VPDFIARRGHRSRVIAAADLPVKRDGAGTLGERWARGEFDQDDDEWGTR
jgi:hypothetical protein